MARCRSVAVALGIVTVWLFPDTGRSAPSQPPPASAAPSPATPAPATGAEPTPAPAKPATVTAPRVGPDTPIETEPAKASQALPGGRWKPAGLPGRSAFYVPVAGRDNPYGPRAANLPQLSLDQITRYALDNPAIASAREKVAASQAQLAKARFAWIPVVNTVTTLSPGASVICDDLVLAQAPGSPETTVDFQWCRSGRDPDLDISTVEGYFRQIGDAGVRFSFRADAVIPVFSFGRKLKHLKKLGRAGVALARLQKIATEQETMLLVRRAHVTLLLARESKAILWEAKDVVDKAYDRVVADVGDPDDWAADIDETDDARDPDDLTKVELAAVELELKMREALKVEALALSALWALAGAAAPEGFDIDAQRLTRQAVQGGLQPVADYVEIAGKARPEAKMAGAAVVARKAQERLARAAFLPDLGVPVSFGIGVANAADREMNQMYYQDGFNYSRFTAALAMQWRWDTGAIFELRRARAEVRAQEHQRDAARLLLSQDVHKAYQDLIEAQAKMEASDRAATLSWRLVLSQQLSDAGGGGNSTELLRALEKWYTRRFESAEAIHAHTEALARLSRAVGRPIATVRAPSAGDPAAQADPKAAARRPEAP